MTDETSTRAGGSLPPDLLIVGASTRAAACSALRAGLQPMCIDLFADLDLQAVAAWAVCEDYPRGLPQLIAGLPACPWMYTGALENAPRVIEEISARRRLLGNSAEIVEGVRDPLRLQQLLASHDLPALAVAKEPPPAGDPRTWLLKPLKSAGGNAVAFWDGRQTADLQNLSPGVQGPPGAHFQKIYYWQEYRAGRPVSGLYLAAPRQSWLLGISEQFIARESSSPPSPFAYCGGIAPAIDERELWPRLERVGRIVAQEFGLRGLFGCDFVDDGQEAWLLEVNPRYPASAELHELARNVPLLDWHVQACAEFAAQENSSSPPRHLTPDVEAAIKRPAQRFVAKQILYAAAEGLVPDWSHLLNQADGFAVPELADIPAPGTCLKPGQPVCTLLAEAATPNGCLELLAVRVQRVVEQLQGLQRNRAFPQPRS